MKFKHTGMGGIVIAKSAGHAAEILARREYGRSRGCVGAFRHDNDLVSRDGKIIGATYQAYIGKSIKGGGVSGRNIWIYQ